MNSYINLSLKYTLLSAVFWIFPVLSLIAANLEQVQLNASIRLILILFLSSILVLFAANQVFRSPEKALIFSFLLAILFSTYGHVYYSIENFSIGDVVIGRHRVMIGLVIVLFLSAFLVIFRMKEIHTKYVNFFIPVSIVLLVFPLYQIVSNAVRQLVSSPEAGEMNKDTVLAVDENLPDIYLFVLDGYGRSDLIKESFAYDNSPFLKFLSNNGFFIAECSQSNYTSTWYSVASMLNMDYLEAMPPINGETRRVPSMVPYIKHSFVREKLESMGYRTVAFETGFGFTELTDADVYFQPEDANISRVFLGRVNPFELLYLRTTLASIWMDLSGISSDDIEKAIKRDRQDYIYSVLQKEVLNIDSPKFIFAHLLTTHNPFVYEINSFDQNPVVKKFGVKTRGYHDSLVYSDEQMIKVLQKILDTSSVQPVIIVTGDHGPSIVTDKDKSVDNLYAVYLGGRNKNQFYASITPVNTFRVVFNSVFNEDYELLPDRSYYAIGGKREKLILIENSCAIQ